MHSVGETMGTEQTERNWMLSLRLRRVEIVHDDRDWWTRWTVFQMDGDPVVHHCWPIVVVMTMGATIFAW